MSLQRVLAGPPPQAPCVPGSAQDGEGGQGAGQGATVPGRPPRGRVLGPPSGDPRAQAVTPPCLLAAAAFFVGSAKHVAQPVTELESGAEAAAGTLANPLGTAADTLGALNPLGTLNLLKLLLASLGIPVNHLVEGSQKCVAELGPEAMGALKTLLVTWAPREPSCTGVPSRPASKLHQGCPGPSHGCFLSGPPSPVPGISLGLPVGTGWGASELQGRGRPRWPRAGARPGRRQRTRPAPTPGRTGRCRALA